MGRPPLSVTVTRKDQKEIAGTQRVYSLRHVRQTMIVRRPCMATALVRPPTVTGMSRSVVAPSPSWPDAFLPQRALLSARIAHVWNSPAATATALVRPKTITGVGRVVVVPSPSWPLLFKPQQRTVPSSFTWH